MIRSLLYVPASSERFIQSAHSHGADAIILDLEDAVAVSEKSRARAALERAVPRAGQSGARVFVRVNQEPERFFADAEAACRAGAFGLYLPKVSCVQTLEQLDQFLSPIEAEMNRQPLVFVPLIEDAKGVLNVQTIAAGPRLFALIAGGEDLATSMGAQPTPEVLRLPKLLVHMAAKAAGLFSFGLLRTVADYRDPDVIRDSVREARDFGFDGAGCIHPSVVPLLNEGFTPTASEIDRAKRLIAAAVAAEQQGVGAFTFEGDFVDVPIVARARALLERIGQ